MSKADTILDAISTALEKHFNGEVKRNASSVVAQSGTERFIVRIRTKKAQAKAVAPKAKRQPKKAAA